MDRETEASQAGRSSHAGYYSLNSCLILRIYSSLIGQFSAVTLEAAMGRDAGGGAPRGKSKIEYREIHHAGRKHNSTHPSHLRVPSRTPPGPRRRSSTPPKTQCRRWSAERERETL